MIHYFSRIPAAAVFVHVDGRQYARIPHQIDGFLGRVVENFDAPRMVRFENRSFIKGGEAYVWFCSAGDKVPVPGWLPYGVTAIAD